MSDSDSSRSRPTYCTWGVWSSCGFGCLSTARTWQPKPSRISIVHRPILPVPSTPTVLPCMSKPVNPSSTKLPERLRMYAWCRRRLSIIMSGHGELGDRIRRVRGHADDVQLQTLAGLEVDMVESGTRSAISSTPSVASRSRTVGAAVVVDEDADDLRILSAARAVSGLSGART